MVLLLCGIHAGEVEDVDPRVMHPVVRVEGEGQVGAELDGDGEVLPGEGQALLLPHEEREVGVPLAQAAHVVEVGGIVEVQALGQLDGSQVDELGQDPFAGRLLVGGIEVAEVAAALEQHDTVAQGPTQGDGLVGGPGAPVDHVDLHPAEGGQGPQPDRRVAGVGVVREVDQRHPGPDGEQVVEDAVHEVGPAADQLGVGAVGHGARQAIARSHDQLFGGWGLRF